ncbi:MAG: hypothetical protein L3J12_02680 [Spirochaetales bacterium]|nr:hypothetical protein [Spirochaetales bacterium]
MAHDTTGIIDFKKDTDTWSVLEKLLREGAQKMLIQAIENEVDEFINKHSLKLDTNGHRIVVRISYSPEREIVTGLGPFAVKAPRIDDRKLNTETEERFSSIIRKYSVNPSIHINQHETVYQEDIERYP